MNYSLGKQRRITEAGLCKVIEMLHNIWWAESAWHNVPLKLIFQKELYLQKVIKSLLLYNQENTLLLLLLTPT